MSGTQIRGGQIAAIPLDAASGEVSGILPIANGGTGAATQTLNNVLLGNGTGALQNVAPGASGNVLTSNGTTWTSSPPTGGGSSPTTTKGDLHGFSTVDARIPVGSDGQVLVVDSGNALGLSYQSVNFQTRRNSQVASSPGATTLNFFGMAAGPTITSGVAAANGDDADGSFLTISTTAVAGNVASIVSPFTQLRRDWDFDLSIRIKTSALASVPRLWVGAFSASPAASDTPSVHIAGFRFVNSGVAASANWRAITAAGSATQTNTDTGVPYAQNAVVVLRVVSNSAAGTITFYINGKSVAVHSTNLPTATTLLGHGVFNTAMAGVASTVKFAWTSIMMK